MEKKNIISWSRDYFLDWSDFQAEFNPAAFEDAHSSIKYRCTWTVNSESFGRDIKFFIENIQLTPEFHKHLSWVRPYMTTLQLLNHEQGRFDLSQLLSAQFTKKIKEIFENKLYPTRGQNEEQRKQFAREDSGIMINHEVKKYENLFYEKQLEYDNETDFGKNIEKQSEYDLKFNALRK